MPSSRGSGPRWSGSSVGTAYRGRDVLVVGSGNSGAEIATELAEKGAARVRVAVWTPPNIVRRDTFGFPSQVVGIALRRAPERVINRVGSILRRLTIPDLAPFGLPAPPGNGYTQFVRTRTVPILDVGFVDAVRKRRIEIVPAVTDVMGKEVVLPTGAGSRRTPSSRRPPSGPACISWA